MRKKNRQWIQIYQEEGTHKKKNWKSRSCFVSVVDEFPVAISIVAILLPMIIYSLWKTIWIHYECFLPSLSLSLSCYLFLLGCRREPFMQMMTVHTDTQTHRHTDTHTEIHTLRDTHTDTDVRPTFYWNTTFSSKEPNPFAVCVL